LGAIDATHDSNSVARRLSKNCGHASIGDEPAMWTEDSASGESDCRHRKHERRRQT